MLIYSETVVLLNIFGTCVTFFFDSLNNKKFWLQTFEQLTLFFLTYFFLKYHRSQKISSTTVSNIDYKSAY